MDMFYTITFRITKALSTWDNFFSGGRFSRIDLLVYLVFMMNFTEY